MEDYVAFRVRLEADFLNNPLKYVTALDVMRAGIIPDEAHDIENRHIMMAAERLLKITYKQFQSALDKHAKEIERKAKADRAAALQAQMAKAHAEAALLGSRDSFGEVLPRNAREAVRLFCEQQKVTVAFDYECRVDGVIASADKPIDNRVILTAESYGLTFGEGRCMTNGGIKMAWAEHVNDERDMRKQQTWHAICRSEPVSAARALRQLRELCDKLFLEPAFADAAIRKFIWQVKRRMAGLYIEHLHVLVFGGGQGTGKSEFARNLIRPISELCCESAMDEVVDDKNFTIKSMFVAFVDEMARADRADINKIKTVVTQETNTSRRLYTNTAQKVAVNLSLLATADKRLNRIISDQAGMRRFVEVMTIPKHRATHFDWEAEVGQFPWKALWQAVDHQAVDPLMSQFADELAAKQEDMRGRDNVECWLENFETTPKRLRSLQPKAYVEGRYVEIGAESLYLQSFRPYEAQFHPGSSETSMTAWGKTMKAMIEGEKIPLWSHRTVSHKTYYRLELDNVVSIRRPSTAISLPQDARLDAQQQQND